MMRETDGQERQPSPLRFLTLAKVSELSRLGAYCLKAVENLRKAEVMAGGTAQALGRRVRALGTLMATTAVPNH